MKNTIGVGLITCNREEYFKQSFPTIPTVDVGVVINDGEPYSEEAVNLVKAKGWEYIQHSTNKGVGVSKNEALRYLINNDADHLFIQEDDILVKNHNVYQAYIEAAKQSGIWHLNFALHGPANRDVQGAPAPRTTADYEGGAKIKLYPNCVGAFTYFYKGVIKAVGYHDERFWNAFEHVEHTYRIIKLGLHPPFWWFADIGNSTEYLCEIPGSIEGSSIPHTPKWLKSFTAAMNWYHMKHGHTPQQTPDSSLEDVCNSLEFIEKHYAKV